ncbi:MAG TPA: hypothetical protein VI197_10255, partial [Polyangiaceae bacterium]
MQKLRKFMGAEVKASAWGLLSLATACAGVLPSCASADETPQYTDGGLGGSDSDATTLGTPTTGAMSTSTSSAATLGSTAAVTTSGTTTQGASTTGGDTT